MVRVREEKVTIEGGLALIKLDSPSLLCDALAGWPAGWKPTNQAFQRDPAQIYKQLHGSNKPSGNKMKGNQPGTATATLANAPKGFGYLVLCSHSLFFRV